MEKVSFCLIGAGRAGMVHARNLVHYLENAELLAIVESNERVLKESGRDLDVQHLFTQVDDALSYGRFDAVVVGTPTYTHREVVIKCAHAKKHIFCEKPMSIRVDEANDMIGAVEKNRVKFQIGFMRRFDPAFRKAKKIIESGELGEVMIVKSIGRGPGLPPPWSYNIAESNGVLGEVNSHDFDSCRWLAGSEYKRIYAESVNRKVQKLKEKYPDFYDNAVCTVRFKNDVIGTIDGTCPVDYGYDARTELVLSKGLIQIGEVQGETLFTCDVHGSLKTSTFKSWRNRFRDAYINEMSSFIRCMQNDTVPAVGGVDGRAAVEAVIAANRSLKDNVPVEL